MVSIDVVKDEDVLNAVKNRGPIIPLEIRGVLKKGDSITIGASLSGLAKKGLILVTNVKKGGSPFYYFPGQEHRLESLGQYLNEKDLRTFEYLRKNYLLRDKTQEPLTRVSLRNIPDFSKRMQVMINDEPEIFWRWHTVKEHEAMRMIHDMIGGRKEQEKEEVPVKPEPVQEPVQEKEQQEQKPVEEEKPPEKPVEHPKKEERPVEKEKQESQMALSENDFSSFFIDNGEPFLNKVKHFFDRNNIFVSEAKLMRKGSDYEFIIEFDSPVGRAEYFCKAKSKKKCNDGDLSSAYLQGQGRRLPVFFLTSGEVTKKAKEKLRSDFKGMMLKEI